MKEIFGRFFAILLVGLLLIKVSAFHVYEHQVTLDDSNEHCELCVLSLESQQFDGALTPSVTYDNNLHLVAPKLSITSFNVDYIDTFYQGNLYSRPPPKTLG